MSQEDNPSTQGDSTSKTPLPSATPKNQANSNPVTESKKPNNPTTETSNKEEEKTEEKRNRFKEWLYKYVTEDNPILDSNELNKKYPIDTLASIFKIQEKDHKIICCTSILLLVHIIFYYLNWTYFVDLLRITITAIFLLFVTKNVYSAYQNRIIVVDSFKKYPLQFFTTIIAVGGLFALVAPAVMNVLKLVGDSSALTTAILTITGGFIAVFGLIKSHQKSELEREQLETQKQKDNRDHIRQLHDSYNDRFDKAVAELNGSDVKAAYAAVPKLAKLVDSWLDYEDLSNDKEELKKLKKKVKKEAQTIINILCKYIRTMPGDYTEKDLKDIVNLSATDQDKLKNESEVRRLIFSEMSERCSKITIENGKKSTVPGLWSEFNFDFSRAPIFYPLHNLTIEQGQFSSARFYGEADFWGVEFTGDANFGYAEFTGDANFGYAEFTGDAYFGDAKFTKNASFRDTKFIENADFRDAEFTGNAYFGDVYFGGAKFTKNADFRHTKFTKNASFRHTKFTKNADFRHTNFTKNADFRHTNFTKNADFRHTKFTGNAYFGDEYFGGTKFSGNAYFGNAEFTKDADFRNTKFTKNAYFGDAYFGGARFTGNTSFNRAYFKKYAPTFADKSGSALFSVQVDPQDYVFSVRQGSKPINCGTATLDSKSLEIPLGAVLFNPSSGETSGPAKPIDKSDIQGETPSK